jgi:ASCH domain
VTGYAITVRQPWASMIITGVKTTEYRSWRTSHRGLLYIHAGLAYDDSTPDWDGPPLIYGAILGHVELVRVTGRPGDFRWHLADPVALAGPVRCSGRLGLWRWSE